MRVAYVTMQFPVPSETFAVRDIRALHRLGVKVEVFTIKPAHKDVDRLKANFGLDQIQVHEAQRRIQVGDFIRAIRFVGLGKLLWLAGKMAADHNIDLNTRLRYLFVMPRAAMVAADIARSKPDIVHLFWGHYPSLVTLFLQDKLRSAKFSMFLGAYDIQYAGLASQWAANHSVAVFTHANANLAVVQSKVGDSRVLVVRRGIEVKKYPELRELDHAVDPYLLVTAGRLIKEKGMDDVIRIFKQVHIRKPLAQLAVLGDGPERNSLVELARELGLGSSIKFYGHIGENDVREIMLRAKLFVLLSRKEGERLPNVVKEAMAAGSVCVVSRTPGIEELIYDGIDGYVWDGVDRGELISTICRHIGVPERELMQKKGRGKIEMSYDVDENMKKYLDVWLS